jgi:hypothetical protein
VLGMRQRLVPRTWNDAASPPLANRPPCADDFIGRVVGSWARWWQEPGEDEHDGERDQACELERVRRSALYLGKPRLAICMRY